LIASHLELTSRLLEAILGQLILTLGQLELTLGRLELTLVVGLTLRNVAYNYMIPALELSYIDVTCYADDTLLVISGRSQKEILEKSCHEGLKKNLEEAGLKLSKVRPKLLYCVEKN
jgi:hypothetical protein